ncbi:glycosyltransferase [Paenibacillus sp. FJAT-27812]|uniref:glycosyltransferase n=1 Tax=Paenibacillus sp. FJAT-27812 TaxID=1684143 RepID=UPI0006A7864E|nr:glycosyltransferase [Paenibacillus sp. FJAT-27812]
MKEKRILWLLNHDTLSKFELPLIRELGFEIYTPKIASKEIFQSSGSITFDYDDTLTIPQEDLQLLNEYNFFSNSNMPLRIKKILNTHFKTAITYTDTSFFILRKLIHNFDGLMFFRAFGVGMVNFKNYTELLDYYFDNNDNLKLKQIGERFWFSQCYTNLSEIENQFLRDNTVYMPLGLPEEFYDIENQWTGESDNILFFCTRIKLSSESEQIYKDFKRDFKGFEYLVAGNQPVSVDDEKVLGFLEREDLNELYKNCKVMYYHSTHQRHLHYHPLEAMIAGMPVIYMDGGLLSIIADGHRQSGNCKNINEARKKIKRILDGDIQLIENIKEDQKIILYKFSYEFNKREWERNFLPIISDFDINFNENRQLSKKISIFNPDPYSKAHKHDYSELVMAISKSMNKVFSSTNISYNVLSDNYNLDEDFQRLQKDGVAIREFSFESITNKNISDSLGLMFKKEDIWNGEYVLPTDHAQNYNDADYWLFLDDKIENLIAPIIPFGIYVENIDDRFCHRISKTRIANLKSASFIITSSKQTKIDLIKHLGLHADKIFIIPFFYAEPRWKNSITLNDKHILIEVDMIDSEFIRSLINDIQSYFSLYKNHQNIIINVNGCIKNKSERIITEFKNMILESDLLTDHLVLLFDNGINEYDALYAHAKKVVIPRNINNIIYKLSKAAIFEKPVVLNNYPSYRDFEFLSDNLHYKNFLSKDKVLIEVLHESSELQSTQYEPLSNLEVKIDELSQVWRQIL